MSFGSSYDSRRCPTILHRYLVCSHSYTLPDSCRTQGCRLSDDPGTSQAQEYSKPRSSCPIYGRKQISRTWVYKVVLPLDWSLIPTRTISPQLHAKVAKAQEPCMPAVVWVGKLWHQNLSKLHCTTQYPAVEPWKGWNSCCWCKKYWFWANPPSERTSAKRMPQLLVSWYHWDTNR